MSEKKNRKQIQTTPFNSVAQKKRNIQLREEIDLPSTTYATFGLYPYPAKFIPHVPAYVLKNYAHPRMKMFDPYAGYGTVGMVSRIYNCHYELWDLNPILEHIHNLAILEPKETNINRIIKQLKISQEEFKPDWSNLDYWYHEEFLPFLFKIWGYYHSIQDDYIKTVLTIPLLRTTRYYSYDDQQRQKLSKSDRSEHRVQDLLSNDWKKMFFNVLEKKIENLLNGMCEYQELSPKKVKSVVKGGTDTFCQELEEEKDMLITSPPYLQSQEYIRHAKNDLFWLGYKEDYIKKLSKLEIPYRDIEKTPIYSQTFLKRREEIEEDKFKELFNNYFWGVLGSLNRLQEKIRSYMFLFVGRASLRGTPVKIDQIFAEHFSALDWIHEETLVDTIVSKRMFRYDTNPASGLNDSRTKSEYLVILSKR